MVDTKTKEPTPIDVRQPRGALTFLKLILESEDIKLTGRAFALSQQCLLTFATIIEQSEISSKKSESLEINEVGDSIPTLKKVQDTKSK